MPIEDQAYCAGKPPPLLTSVTVVVVKTHPIEDLSVNEIGMIGLDIAKNVFQAR